MSAPGPSPASPRVMENPTGLRAEINRNGSIRRIEAEVITGLSGLQSAVVSAGGGAPGFSANLTVLSSLGTTVYLKASAQELYQRIKNDRTRPLMQVENPRAQVATLLRTREPFYRQADIVMDTEVLSVDEVVDKLIDELAKRTIETQME